MLARIVGMLARSVGEVASVSMGNGGLYARIVGEIASVSMGREVYMQ